MLFLRKAGNANQGRTGLHHALCLAGFRPLPPCNPSHPTKQPASTLSAFQGGKTQRSFSGSGADEDIVVSSARAYVRWAGFRAFHAGLGKQRARGIRRQGQLRLSSASLSMSGLAPVNARSLKVFPTRPLAAQRAQQDDLLHLRQERDQQRGQRQPGGSRGAGGGGMSRSGFLVHR